MPVRVGVPTIRLFRDVYRKPRVVQLFLKTQSFRHQTFVDCQARAKARQSIRVIGGPPHGNGAPFKNAPPPSLGSSRWIRSLMGAGRKERLLPEASSCVDGRAGVPKLFFSIFPFLSGDEPNEAPCNRICVVWLLPIAQRPSVPPRSHHRISWGKSGLLERIRLGWLLVNQCRFLGRGLSQGGTFPNALDRCQ